LSNKITVHTRI